MNKNENDRRSVIDKARDAIINLVGGGEITNTERAGRARDGTGGFTEIATPPAASTSEASAEESTPPTGSTGTTDTP